MVKKAIKLSFDSHKDQVDKSGMPYVYHPFHLAEQMPNENATIVALLHDVVEDTDRTIEDIAELGFNEEIIEALKLLTHDDNMPYFDYVKRLAPNELARMVKIADLTHNSDLTRLDNITKADLARVEKYKRCLEFLKNYNQEKKPSEEDVKIFRGI
jgi:(p)ppGpp synthase/HD superfamily hydrolase